MRGAVAGTAFERADVEAAVEAARAARDEAMRAFEGRGRDAGGRERAREDARGGESSFVGRRTEARGDERLRISWRSEARAGKG